MCHQLHSLCGLQLAIMAPGFVLPIISNSLQLCTTSIVHTGSCWAQPAGAILPLRCWSVEEKLSIDTFWKPSSQSPIISDSFQTRFVVALLSLALKFMPPFSHFTIFAFPCIWPPYPRCIIASGHNRESLMH